MTVKGLSEEYVSELLQATAKDRPAPFSREETERKAVEQQIMSVLGKFIRRDSE